MVPLVSILLSAVGHLGVKLVESAFKNKTPEASGADFGKELQQCRLDDVAAAPDGSVRYAQAGAALTASDIGGSSLTRLSPAEAASEYSKLARQWPGRPPSAAVIDWFQAP